MTALGKFRKPAWLAIAIIFQFQSIAALAVRSDDPAKELSLIRDNNPEMLNILARRLIDPQHWYAGTRGGVWPKGDNWVVPASLEFDPDRPYYLGYGSSTFEHWKAGNEYVLENFERLPTVEDLKKVHSVTFFNEPSDMFWGYYRYQIWRNFPAEARPSLYKLLDRAQVDQGALQELFKRGIKNGRGVLRVEGDTSWSGKPWNLNTKSSDLFTQKEFDNLAKNTLLRPQILKRTENGIDARFWHPPGSEVERLTQDLFTKATAEAASLRAQRQMLGDRYRAKAVGLAADFYRQLVLIHPLWDGAGRTSKLMRDWLLRYLRLPPPAQTPENDMELTSDKYGRILERDIRETEKAMDALIHPPKAKKGKGVECLIPRINHALRP
jgi:hypothetical protein